MVNPTGALSGLEPRLHRDLSVTALVPPFLWQGRKETLHLPEGDIKRFQAVVVRIRLQGPTDAATLLSIMTTEPAVMVVVLNTLYANVVSAIVESGGIITEMTFNRLTAVFPLEGETQAGQVYRALVGLENALKAVKDKVPPGYPNIQWRASGGVGSGSVLAAILSSDVPERKELLVDGAALDQAEEALNWAKNGQVVAHRDVMKRLGAAPNGRWLGTHFFLPGTSFSSMIISDVLQYTRQESSKSPYKLLQLPDMTQQHRLSLFLDPLLRIAPPFVPLQNGLHIKRLAVLAVRILDLGLVNENAIQRWNKVFKVVGEHAAQYNGLVDHLAIESEAGEVRIVFGAPYPQENTANQAAGCALSLQRALTEIEPSVRISLAAQRGFAALLGTSTYSSYTVISPALERAVYLLSHAQAHEILADRGIQQSTETAFAWRGVSLPGANPEIITEGEAIFALAGEVVLGSGLRPRHQLTRQMPLIGRDEEKKRLVTIVQRCCSGDATLLLVTGDAGHGRSALIDETIRLWLDAGGNGFISIGSAYDLCAPYTLWMPIWQAIFGLSLDASPQYNLMELEKALSRLLPDVDWGAALYARVLGLTRQPLAAIDELAPMARQQRIFETTLAILKKLAGTSPIMLVFEYLDHADSLSLELLLQLSEHLEDMPILLCVEDRGLTDYSLESLFLYAEKIKAHPFTGDKVWSLFETLLPEIQTLPLSFQTVLEKRLGAKTASSPTKNPITPFDVIVLANTLRYLFLKRQGEAWDIANSTPPEEWAQDTIEGMELFLAKVLSPEEAKIIVYATVSGMMFHHDARWIKNKSLAGLSSLERIRQLHLCEPYLDEGYTKRWDRFRHRIIRETLYSRLTLAERTALHTQVADWASDHYPGYAGMALVAVHAEYAGQFIRAFDAFLQAAEHAANWGATAEAMQSLLAAERLLTRHAEIFSQSKSYLLRITVAKASLHLRMALFDKGREEINKAIAYANELHDTATLAKCLVLSGRFAHLEKDYATIQRVATQAGLLAEVSHDKETLAQALWLQARVLYARTQHKEAAKLLRRAIHSTSGNNTALEIEISLDAARIMLADYQRDRAQEYIERAFQLSLKLGDPVLMHQAYTQLGVLRLIFGKAQSALEALEAALGLPPSSDSTIGSLGSLLINHALALCYLGRYTDAEITFDTAHDYFMAEDNIKSVWELKLLRASEVYLDRHLDERARLLLDEIHERIPELDADRHLLYYLTRASLHIRANHFDKAGEALEKFNNAPKSYAKEWYTPLYHLREAEQSLAKKEYTLAAKQARQSLGAVAFLGDLRWLTAAYGLLAEALILSQEPHETIYDALQRAMQTARVQGRNLHAARVHLLMGHYLQHNSALYKTRAKGSTYRFEAGQMYREMGILPPERIAIYDTSSRAAQPVL